MTNILISIAGFEFNSKTPQQNPMHLTREFYQLKKTLVEIVCVVEHMIQENYFEFSLNVFTEFSEFSDKNNIILKKGLLYLSLLSLVQEISTLLQC